MGATTMLPPSLLPRRSAAADLHPCSSRVPVNPALMANPAAAKTPKRPMSVRDGQPPAKRARDTCSGGELLNAAVAAKINSSSLPCPGTSSSGEDPRSPTATKNPVASSPETATQPSMRELIQNARLAMARAAAQEEEAGRRCDIERSRAEARRKVEQMVDTVQFNDPWIDPSDVTRSPEELLQARQEAWRYQAQLIAMARQRDMHEGWW
ncbi:hypothetical protein VPH35_124663 [Triticum aestivum]